MSRLEAITKGRLNWIREPYVGHRVMHKCAHEEHLDEHYICYDHFPPPSERAEPCIIYDMGIREQPGFGKTLAEKYPQCQVRHCIGAALDAIVAVAMRVLISKSLHSA